MILLEKHTKTILIKKMQEENSRERKGKNSNEAVETKENTAT